jgi:hypothetical protein
MSDKKTAGMAPAERWVDRVRYVNETFQCLYDEDGSILGPLPDRFQVVDLPKTTEEKIAIEEAVAALNEFRRILCGLPPVIFPESRVHILTKDEFRSKVAPNRFHGKAHFGHVYLWRGWPMPVFQALLAHEMVHAVSYLWFDISKPGTVAYGLELPPILQRRQGLILTDPSYHTLLPHFHGLNEGATETAAMIIRSRIASGTRLLDDAGKRVLSKFVASPPLVGFTERLAQIAAGPGGDTLEPYRKLYIDCFTGTDEFLKMLESRLPGATEVLRATGAQPHELAAAADKLGWPAVAAAIRKYAAAVADLDDE